MISRSGPNRSRRAPVPGPGPGPGRAAVAVGAVMAAVVAGCSNAEPTINKNPHAGRATATAAARGIQQIVVTSGPDLRFHPSTLVVHPGRVRIVLENKVGAAGGPPHDLKFTGLPGSYLPLTQPGETQSVTFTAPAPGRYSFVCTIHTRQGQTGVMIVTRGAGG